MDTHIHHTNADICKLRLENIVITYSLGQLIDLDVLARRCKHVICPPNEFAAGVGRFVYPSCVFFVFSTGSVIIAGLKHIAACELAAVMLCDIIRTMGGFKHVCINDFKTINLTIAVNVGSSINILKIKDDHPTFILKNVGRFPNIVWPSDSSLSLCIFEAGKINVVGATTIEMAKEGFDSGYPELQPYLL
jgi:TATA-box binding protein (TBP) (component of TFIID and TFIIIB)